MTFHSISLNDQQLLSCCRVLAYRSRNAEPDPERETTRDETRHAADRALRGVISDHMAQRNWILESPPAGYQARLNGHIIVAARPKPSASIPPSPQAGPPLSSCG